VSSSELDTEIDLIELVNVLWQGKYLIGGLTAFVCLMTFAFLTFMPATHQITLSIRSLSPQEISAYAPLNNVPGISTPIYADEQLIGQTGVVLAHDLMQAVRSEINSKTSLRQAIAELDPKFSNFEGSLAERAQALTQAASQFDLTSEPFKGTRIVTDILVTKTQNTELTKQIIARAIDLTRENIRRQNLTAIANLSKSIETALAYEIEELQAEIANDKQRYFDEMQHRIQHLEEQAAIARALNLASPSQNMTINATASTGEPQNARRRSDSSYVQGFKALEEEVKLLAERKPNDWQLFTPDYAEKAYLLRQLQNDRRLKRVETGLALSPLANEEAFAPAIFDMESILVEQSTSKPLIFILVALLSGLLASIFVLFRHYAAQRTVISAS
jgi:LPS O-antigen subunit length determinant protein (WzzB/FepE family)